MRILIIFFLSIFCISCAATKNNSNVCQGNGAVLGYNNVKQKNILLFEEQRDSFSFYYRSFDYAILISPENIVAYVESDARGGTINSNSLGSILVNKIKNNIPLKENVDIFRYSLDSPELLSYTKYVVAGLLEKGNVSVLDLAKGGRFFLHEISVNKIEQGGVYRFFCEPYKAPMLMVVDEIWD